MDNTKNKGINTMIKGKKTAKALLLLFVCSGIVIAADNQAEQGKSLNVGNDSGSTDFPKPDSLKDILDRLSDLLVV